MADGVKCLISGGSMQTVKLVFFDELDFDAPIFVSEDNFHEVRDTLRRALAALEKRANPSVELELSVPGRFKKRHITVDLSICLQALEHLAVAQAVLSWPETRLQVIEPQSVSL